MFFIGGTRRPIVIGKAIGGGGEGIVHEVEGASDTCAKIFSSARPSEQTLAKVGWMAGRPAPTPALAWPQATLVDGSNSTKGFIMKKFSSYRPVHQLYSREDRLEKFPASNYASLVRAAANVARVFADVHTAGHAVADVNSANILVSKEMHVSVIDVDSFQINAGELRFRCQVGSAEYLAPELQTLSVPFSEVDRTTNHDNFSLAVLIFQFLMFGRHPFAGVALNSNSPTSPRDGIVARAYPYSSQKSQLLGMPPHSQYFSVHPLINAYFDSAFSASLSTRPSASAWASALDALLKSLQQCSAVESHVFAPHLKSCPWCPLGHHGIDPFRAKSSTSATCAPMGQSIAVQSSNATPVQPRTQLPSGPKDLERAVRSLGFTDYDIVDKRPDGCFWVLAGRKRGAVLAALSAYGYEFKYAPDGGRSTGYQKAWWTKLKST